MARTVAVTVAITVAITAVLAGCGFEVSSSAPPGADAAVDGTVADTAIDAPLVLGPWGAPVVVPGLASAFSEDDPSLTADQLEIFYGSDRPGGPGGEDIWTATRASAGAAWGAPQRITELNSNENETTIKVSYDGLTIMFASDRSGIYNDLFVATRTARGMPWTTPQRVSELSVTTASDYAPWLTSEGLRVVFSSFREGNEQLFAATRATVSAAWSAPARLDELATLSTESDPIEPDPRTIYFTSDRDGTLDIFLATRAGPGTPYGTPVAVGELNTAGVDRDPWVSPDQRTIYFSSGRSGNFELYVATR